MPYIIIAIHAMGEAQKEIVASVKKLNSSIPKLREKISEKDCTHKEKTPKKESAVVVGKSSESENGPSFVT